MHASSIVYLKNSYLYLHKKVVKKNKLPNTCANEQKTFQQQILHRK